MAFISLIKKLGNLAQGPGELAHCRFLFSFWCRHLWKQVEGGRVSVRENEQTHTLLRSMETSAPCDIREFPLWHEVSCAAGRDLASLGDSRLQGDLSEPTLLPPSPSSAPRL